MSPIKGMIRNRSTAMITSSCNDLESFVSSNGKSNTSSSKMLLGGAKRWQYFLVVLFLGIISYIYVISGSSTSILPEHRLPGEFSKEQLTIVMNTFKRNDMMLGECRISSF